MNAILLAEGLTGEEGHAGWEVRMLSDNECCVFKKCCKAYKKKGKHCKKCPKKD